MSLPPNVRGDICGVLEASPHHPHIQPSPKGSSCSCTSSALEQVKPLLIPTQMAFWPPHWWHNAPPGYASSAVRVLWWGGPPPGHRIALQFAPQHPNTSDLNKRFADGSSPVRHSLALRQARYHPCTCPVLCTHSHRCENLLSAGLYSAVAARLPAQLLRRAPVSDMV